MKNLSILENKEIFELKKKCKVVQDKISKVVDQLSVGECIINTLNKEDKAKEEKKENEARNMQN